MQRHAFSLIELVVVLTISTLVIATVAVNWTVSQSAVALHSAVESLAHFDASTRTHAIAASKPCTIRFDIQSSECTANRWNNDVQSTRKLHLGTTARITDAGPAGIPVQITPEGASRSYYVAVTVGKKSTWVFFCGGYRAITSF